MNLIEASYYDGNTSKPVSVKLEFSDQTLVIHMDDGAKVTIPWADLHFQLKVGNVPRVIDLPHGACLHVADHAALENVLPHKKDFLHYLENNSKFVISSFASLFAFALIMYFFVIPATAKAIAPKMTSLFGESLTDQTLTYLDKFNISKQVKDNTYHDRLESIRAFEALAPYEKYKILIIDSPELDANAFALPYETIIITKQLMDTVPDDLEVLAIVLHEIGHIEHFHVMQRIVGDSMVSLALFAVFGADWTSVPMVVLSTGYSRNVEKEADIFAARIMLNNDLPPSLLAKALHKIDTSYDAKNGKSVLEYFSTHPSTGERTKYLEKIETLEDIKQVPL